MSDSQQPWWVEWLEDNWLWLLMIVLLVVSLIGAAASDFKCEIVVRQVPSEARP